MTIKLRVLHVFGLLNRGGAETMIMNLYRQIDRDKIQFDFVVHSTLEGDYDKEIKELGGNIYNLPKYTILNHFQYKKEWNTFMREHPEISIIHTHVRSSASVFLKIAKSHNIPTIAHSHSTSNGGGIQGFVKNITQFPIRFIADYFFSASDKAGVWLFGKKIVNNVNYSVLNNAIKSEDYIFNQNQRDTIRNELGIQNKFVIGHVGRFHESKNHFFLLDIFKEIYETNKESILMLVGDGLLKEDVVNKISRMNLTKNVLLMGVRDDVNKLMQAMDVFVFPSKFEGLPVTVIEAQATGLPVVLSDQITKEVSITELTKFISIDKEANVWKNEILNSYNRVERKNMEKEIIKSGYDVKTTVIKLQNFYLKISK